MDKQVGIIYETQDYSMFKHLEGNRTDAVARGAKIIKSIRENGYILSPIAINENAEVIDGQGRLYALECEALPVHYYVVPGAGIDECIAMNIYGTKWKMNDYIESYASRGKQPYKALDECETAGGKDMLRLAQMFVNSVDVNSKYDNTAYIIGLAGILSGNKVAPIPELKKINRKLFVKKAEEWMDDDNPYL